MRKVILFSVMLTAIVSNAQVQVMTGFGKADGRDSAMLQTLLNYAPQQLPGWQINFTTANFVRGNYSSTIEGDAELVGISPVKYRATYLSTDTLGSFQVNFPAASRIKPSSINSVVKGSSNWTQFYLPPALRDAVLLDSLDFRFPETGLPSSKSYYLGFKVLEDWQIFDQIDLKLSKIAMGFFAGPPAENSTKSIDMQGYLSGYIKWRDVTEVSITSNLTTDIYDWVISLDARSLRLSDLIRLFKIDDLMGVPVPPGILDLTLDKATLDIRPVKGIELLALTSLGNLNLVIERTTVDQKPVSTEDPKQKDYTGKPERKNALQSEFEKNGLNDPKAPVNGGVVAKPADETTWINNPLYDASDTRTWVSNPLYQPPANTPSNGNNNAGPNNQNTSSGNNENPKKPVPATEAKQSKWGFMAGISLPENFRVGDHIPELKFLDKFQLYNAAIYLSSFAAAPQNSLPVHRNLGSGNPVLLRGMNILYGYDLEKINISKKLGTLGDLTGINFICFSANISKSVPDISVSGGINFNRNVNIAKRVYFPYAEIMLKPFASSPEVSLLLYTDVKIDNKTTLNFRGKASLTASTAVVIGGAMVNDWVNPFGFKGFSIGGLMFQGGVDFSNFPIPTPSDFMITGRASIGGVSGKVIVGVDFNEITKNLLLINVEKLSWDNIITTFCGDNIKKYIPAYVQPLFASKLENARFKFVPPGAGGFTLSNEVFTPGFGVGANGTVAGWSGKFDIALEGFDNGLSAGLKASGEMNEIRVSENGFDVFRISGSNNNGKPKFIIDLTTEKFLKIATGIRQATDTIAYANASVTLLGMNNANAFILLNPQGYYCKMSGKIYGMFEADVEAQIKDFANPLDNTFIRINGMTAGVLRDVQRYLSKVVLDLKISIDKISMEGQLNGLRSGGTATVLYRVAGMRNTMKVNVTVGGALDIAKLVAQEIEKVGQLAIAEIKKIADAAITGLKTTTTAAVNVAKQTTSEAINTANNLKNTMTSVAKSAITNTGEAFNLVKGKTLLFFTDFGKYTQQTVEKIWNKSISGIQNGWGKFTDAMKKAFTGGDNEERIMADGPAFRIYTKYQNNVLASTANTRSNFPVMVRQSSAVNNYLESWQLVPNDKNEIGSFFLVSGYSGLLITKPWATHSILIPHESDHKDRERMLMEAVPNEPGWYYLKYVDYDAKRNTYVYLEAKNVVLNDDKPGFIRGRPQLVIAPVYYTGSGRPGETGKFRFEKIGDIDWQKTKSFPPSMTPAIPLAEGGRYNFAGQAEQYIYTNKSFRWIPDYETLVFARYDAIPIIQLPVNMQVSVVLGPPLPSRKNGSLVKAENESAVYIIESGKRRWIPDVETFNMLGLNPALLQTVSKADLQGIPAGEDLPSKFQPKIVLGEKALYRQVGGDGTVYVVFNRTLRAIPNPATLTAMGYDFSQVQDVSADLIRTLPVGPVIPNRDNGSLLQVNGRPEVYLMQYGIRRLIPDQETFNGMQLDWSKIVKISQDDMAGIPTGPAIVSFK